MVEIVGVSDRWRGEFLRVIGGGVEMMCGRSVGGWMTEWLGWRLEGTEADLTVLPLSLFSVCQSIFPIAHTTLHTFHHVPA